MFWVEVEYDIEGEIMMIDSGKKII